MSGAGRGTKSRAPFRCFVCNGEGHLARNCPQKQQPQCYNCGKPGHLKRDCPDPPRNPSNEHPTREVSRVYDGKSDASSLHREAAGAKSSEDLKNATFIDTHCHLEYVFERFKHHGNFASFASQHQYPACCEGCITTFCDPAAFSPSFGLWPSLLAEENVWGTFGVHPHNAKYYHSSSLEEKLLKCIEHPKCVALGEIGLDYAAHSPSDPDTQKPVLTHQLQLAVTLQKPIILHCRDAEEDMLTILSSAVPHDWKIHLHCYTGTPNMATKFLTRFPNLFIGVCGNVTYDDHSNVQRVAIEVPLERMLLETDAPYNTPKNLPRHMRGRFSHPAMAFYTAKAIAQRKGMDIGNVLKTLRHNTRIMYSI